MIDFV